MSRSGKEGAPVPSFRQKRNSATLFALILIVVTPVESFIVGDDDPTWSSNWIGWGNPKCGAFILGHAERLSERAAASTPSPLPRLRLQIFQTLQAARSWSGPPAGRHAQECGVERR